MAKSETLIDDFEDGTLAAVWEAPSGSPSVTESSGFLNLTPDATTTFPYCRTLAVTWDIQASYIYYDVPQMAAGTSPENYIRFGATATTTDYVGFEYIPPGNLVARCAVANVFQGTSTNVAYSATNHRWLAFREASGTFYWYTAATPTGPPIGTTGTDANGWTVFRSFAHVPAWLNAGRAFMQAGSGASAGVLEIGNVNVIPAPPITNAPETLRVVRSGRMAA